MQDRQDSSCQQTSCWSAIVSDFYNLKRESPSTLREQRLIHVFGVSTKNDQALASVAERVFKASLFEPLDERALALS
jgi:hypothetical protein